MKPIKSIFLSFIIFIIYPCLGQQSIEPFILQEFNVGTEIGKLRSVPIQYAPDKKGILIVYSESEEVDPYVEMFFFPEHTLKLVLFDLQGNEIWRKELGRGVMPGIWFCPVFPFDLDQDGVEEIWYVNNTDKDHPLGYSNYRLARIDTRNGKESGEWQWESSNEDTRLSHVFRNFILGGYLNEKPVLITAQGTYRDMKLQAWNPGMQKRWDMHINDDGKTPRGSHMTPVFDLEGDGNDEIMWGERCISVNDGSYNFIAAEDSWNGHSDIIQPLYDFSKNNWHVFTCRESRGAKGQPRLVMFNQEGAEVWSKLDDGHMDMGWVTKFASYEEPIAFSVRIGKKVAGPDGFFRSNVEEFAYKAYSGEEVQLPFKAYNTVPVDINGDGIHEVVGGLGHQGIKDIVAGDGSVLGNIGEGANVAMASKFMDHPGEQILAYYKDGTIKIWADRNAKDSEMANRRYNSSFYKRNQKLTATGYNLVNLGGI